jgi:hypothetical protein
MFVQQLLGTRPAAYFLIVILVEIPCSKTCHNLRTYNVYEIDQVGIDVVKTENVKVATI